MSVAWLVRMYGVLIQVVFGETVTMYGALYML